jgi:hypothetical protein
MLDLGRLDEHAAIAIAQHPFGPGLGAIDGDDAEVLWTDRLHARLDNAVGFAQNGWMLFSGFASRRARPSAARCYYGGEIVTFKGSPA